MVRLFLSETVSDSISDGIAAKERISLLLKLEPVIWSVITSCGRSEPRLWLCTTISCITLITPREQCKLFMDLLTSKSHKRIVAAQLLQMIFEKKPQKVGPIIAKKSYMLEKFFKGNPRRILQWFGHFAGGGEPEHRKGAKAISQFAFVNRDICWEELEWKGKHGQSPAMVATKPHYFLDLDVIRTVENFLENVPEFWSSDELAESLKDGGILDVDTKFFVDHFTKLMYDENSEDIWELINGFLLEEKFSFLCHRLLILLGERELHAFLVSVSKFLASQVDFKDYGSRNMTRFKYSPSYWLEVLLLISPDCPSIDELLLLNAVINQGRQLLRLILDDEHADEKVKIEEILSEINRGSSDVHHWMLMSESIKMEKLVAVKLLSLQSWVLHYSLSKECKTPESCESLFIRNGISFRKSDDYSLVKLDHVSEESGSGTDNEDLIRVGEDGNIETLDSRRLIGFFSPDKQPLWSLFAVDMGSLSTNLLEPAASCFNPLDAEVFREQAHMTVDFIADYYRDIEKYPVRSQVEPGYLRERLPVAAPYHPEPLGEILGDVQNDIIPGITHWLSPNFFAYFPATASTAAFIGEMLCTSFNVVGFNWLASPAATELESVVMDWLAKLLKLPKSFTFSGGGGGVIQGTTSEAMLCTIVAAREKVLSQLGRGKLDKLIVYGSDQTHSTYQKACKIAGIVPENIRVLPTTADSGFSLSPSILRKAIEDDVAAGLFPLYLCLTLGTTSTTAVDHIETLGEVAIEYGLWIHVDAAFAGSACICPEFRHYLNGVEKVDSLSLSPHKWMLTNLDCCCLWVKKPSLLVQSLSTNPEYLRNQPSDSKMVVDYKDWQVGCGRRFKALKLWLVLRSYGVANLQSHIRSDVRLAQYFESLVRADNRFEIVLPRRFSLVCFRLLSPANKYDSDSFDKLNRKLLEAVNCTGQMYMTHTVVGGIYLLRFVVGASLTEERHVISAWKLIQQKADALFPDIPPV